MPEELDVGAIIARFRERADAVRRRGMPPVEGDERRRIMTQMRLDFQDFAMLGDATGALEDGILVGIGERLGHGQAGRHGRVVAGEGRARHRLGIGRARGAMIAPA